KRRHSCGTSSTPDADSPHTPTLALVWSGPHRRVFSSGQGDVSERPKEHASKACEVNSLRGFKSHRHRHSAKARTHHGVRAFCCAACVRRGTAALPCRIHLSAVSHPPRHVALEGRGGRFCAEIDHHDLPGRESCGSAGNPTLSSGTQKPARRVRLT